jgi:hypothetical protein
MGKTNVMLPEAVGSLLRRLKDDTKAATLTDTISDALSVYSELHALLRGGDSMLCLVSKRDGAQQEVRIPSLSKMVGAVVLMPAQSGVALNTGRVESSQLFASSETPASRMAVARATLERATGRKPMTLQPPPGGSFPSGELGPPAHGMLSLEQASERMGVPVKRLLAALLAGDFEGAIKDENEEWWVPASEARPVIA